MRGHRDLELAAGASALCALMALLLPFEAVRVVFATPLALFLPGYAIATATFAHGRLKWPQLLLLGIALSLSVLALGALMLNYMPGGVRGLSWAVLLVLVVVNGCRVAALRRPRASAGAPIWSRPRLGRAQGAFLGGGAVAAVASLALAMTPLPAKDALGYTELWISPSSNPRGAVAAVGIRSNEQHRIAYFLRVRFGRDKPLVRLLELRPGEERTIRVRTAPPSGAPIPVAASLFRQARPTEVYRRVLGWIPEPAPPR